MGGGWSKGFSASEGKGSRLMPTELCLERICQVWDEIAQVNEVPSFRKAGIPSIQLLINGSILNTDLWTHNSRCTMTMAEMEGIERENHEGEEEGEVEEEVSEGEVLDLWYKVNNEVTLHQPELCVIYTAVYWGWKPDCNPWNDVEIKQIVKHAILPLDEDKYHGLRLTDLFNSST